MIKYIISRYKNNPDHMKGFYLGWLIVTPVLLAPGVINLIIEYFIEHHKNLSMDPRHIAALIPVAILWFTLLIKGILGDDVPGNIYNKDISIENQISQLRPPIWQYKTRVLANTRYSAKYGRSKPIQGLKYKNLRRIKIIQNMNKQLE